MRFITMFEMFIMTIILCEKAPQKAEVVQELRKTYSIKT